MGAARRAGAAALAGPFAAWLEALGGGPGGLLRLEPSPSTLAEVPEADLEEALASAMLERRPREIQAAQTLSGPHRDDLWIGAGEADLRREGSQGEQRTAALAMLLAARDHLRAHAARPILLLDDVLSELDPDRRRLLLEAVRDGGQTIVTSADPAVGGRDRAPAGRAAARGGRAAAWLSGPPPRRRHRREPLTAASAVARFRRRASGGGLGAETGAAAAAWADVVGSAAAAHSVPVRRTRAGVLTVACSSASWAQELTMRRDELRERLLARAPDTGVTALRFSVADHVMTGPPEAPPPPRPAPRPSRGRRARSGPRAAEGVADERLRDLVARAAAASAARRARASGQVKYLQIGD